MLNKKIGSLVSLLILLIIYLIIIIFLITKYKTENKIWYKEPMLIKLIFLFVFTFIGFLILIFY